MEIDYDRALEYYQKTLIIAKKKNIKDLIAGSYLNIGNAYYRKKNYSVALYNYEKSSELFVELNNPIGIIQSLQNRGVIYFSTNQFDKAEKLLLEANEKAKKYEMNSTVASINLNLTKAHISVIFPINYIIYFYYEDYYFFRFNGTSAFGNSNRKRNFIN